MTTKLETLEVDLMAWKLAEYELWMKVLLYTWSFCIKRISDGLIKKFNTQFCVHGD
ncbi:hypothetical protein ACHAW6_000609 [Cyclotella cf. meneghiniana]